MLENPIEIQKRFSTFNKYIIFFIVIYIIENFTHTFEKSALTPILILLPFIAFEFFASSNDFFETNKLSIFLRFSEIMCSLCFLLNCQDITDFGVSAMCYMIFAFEYIIHFDFSDLSNRVICICSITGTVVLAILLKVFLNLGDGDKTHLFEYFIFFVVMSVVIFVVYFTFFKSINDLNEKMFAQERIISNANRVNEELRIHQEKVKKANEELGIQKIKLETANSKIKSVNAEMMIQNDIIKYISSSLEIEKLMSLITDSLFDEMGLDVCAIVLKYNNDDNKETEYKIKSRFGEKYNNNFGEIVEKGEMEEYMNLTEAVVNNRVDESSYNFIKRSTVGSLIIVPLKSESTIGALFAGHPKYDYFKDNISFFESIVGQFAIALKNAKLYLRMEYMATRDGLTAIYNRRYLTKLFNEYLNDSIFNKTSLTVALFDIDKFKNINDTYGHLFGDEVIKSIARLSQETAEENGGIVGRYGGEEFVIVFPNRNLQDSYPAIKQLHQRIKENELFHNGQSIFVRVSVGITSYPETCKNPSELLNRADWAMYYSKQNGRDRITIDKDEIRESVMIK